MLGLIRINNFCFCMMKETISKVKRQPLEWEKITANEATDKELISKICKQLLQLISRKIKDPIKKWAKELKDISPKKTYGWLINTWKDVQHHSLSEKCKSKPQWGIISLQSEWLRSKSLQAINAGEGSASISNVLLNLSIFHFNYFSFQIQNLLVSLKKNNL